DLVHAVLHPCICQRSILTQDSHFIAAALSNISIDKIIGRVKLPWKRQFKTHESSPFFVGFFCRRSPGGELLGQAGIAIARHLSVFLEIPRISFLSRLEYIFSSSYSNPTAL